MTCEAPFPVVTFRGATLRFDFARVALGTASAELFGADFEAVVFAITLFLCETIFMNDYASKGRFRAHQKDETRAP
jgi:hypothetical protein